MDGVASSNAYGGRTSPAQVSGAYLLLDEQVHIDDDPSAGANFPMLARMLNAASGGGISLGYVTPQAANQYNLKVSVRSAESSATEVATATSAAKFSIEAFGQIRLYVHLHATAGKVVLVVGASTVALEMSGINTLAGGNIDTLRLGMWAGSVDSNAAYHDDYVFDNTQYSLWTTSAPMAWFVGMQGVSA
jgi:hypothetical protein